MASRCVGDYEMTGSSGDNSGGDGKSCMLQPVGRKRKQQIDDSAKITDSLIGKTVRCVNGIALPVVSVQAVMTMEGILASLYESKYA